jgi:hypothetical protein
MRWPFMRTIVVVSGIALLVIAAVVVPCLLHAGEVPSASGYSLLNPIRSGNLTVFPVVTANSAAKTYDTAEFLTLDEGLRSGDVIVTEAGQAQGMIRRRPSDPAIMHPVRDAEVNRLVLVNNSKRPLLLLAGEIVTGGKQDRVIGKDRIVPAESDPVDLSVFCVEPGRWVATNGKNTFGSGRSSLNTFAAPSVRAPAMSAQNQQQVWDSVGRSKQAMATVVAGLPAAEISNTSSYSRVMDNKAVQDKVDAVAEPIERDYESVIHQLRDKNAVGVVVAVNGEIVWADIFASTQLLQKYWPKLSRSYATEAVITRAKGGQVSSKDALKFLEDLDGRHETAETEPGLYRQSEITGDGFKVFELRSLLPKTGFAVHVAKMTN